MLCTHGESARPISEAIHIGDLVNTGSSDECKRRKVKCDGKHPCERCIAQESRCLYHRRKQGENDQDQRHASFCIIGRSIVLTESQCSREQESPSMAGSEQD